MPRGTKVDKCFQKLKKKKGARAAAAICQKSTGQSLHTGKPLKRKGKNRDAKTSKTRKR